MAIFKKERVWSEKLTSAEFDIPEVQKGVVALRKRQQLTLILPTTVNRVHSVVLTPLNTRARTILKGGYAASHTKITDLNTVNASYSNVSFSKLVEWRKEVRAEDELIYVPSTKKLYITTRAITSTNSAAASTYAAARVTEALAAGQIVELKEFVSTAANWIPFQIAASTASNSASIGRFAFEVRGYK